MAIRCKLMSYEKVWINCVGPPPLQLAFPCTLLVCILKDILSFLTSSDLGLDILYLRGPHFSSVLGPLLYSLLLLLTLFLRTENLLLLLSWILERWEMYSCFMNINTSVSVWFTCVWVCFMMMMYWCEQWLSRKQFSPGLLIF